MDRYLINYFKNVPKTGWVLQTVRTDAQHMKKAVITLAKTADVRCIDVVQVKNDKN